MLEQMSPWDYQQVRRALGHGSGFDSPGFNSIRKSIPKLWVQFTRALENEKLELLDLFLNHQDHDELYRLAEGLLEIDERMFLWRNRHFKVVERSIGSKVSGTQGTPVEILGRLNSFLFFPELWDIRTTITNYAIAQEGEN
jgi:tryptophan 2,3-dioxygenase